MNNIEKRIYEIRKEVIKVMQKDNPYIKVKDIVLDGLSWARNLFLRGLEDRYE